MIGYSSAISVAEAAKKWQMAVNFLQEIRTPKNGWTYTENMSTVGPTVVEFVGIAGKLEMQGLQDLHHEPCNILISEN